MESLLYQPTKIRPIVYYLPFAALFSANKLAISISTTTTTAVH